MPGSPAKAMKAMKAMKKAKDASAAPAPKAMKAMKDFFVLLRFVLLCIFYIYVCVDGLVFLRIGQRRQC